MVRRTKLMFAMLGHNLCYFYQGSLSSDAKLQSCAAIIEAGDLVRIARIFKFIFKIFKLHFNVFDITYAHHSNVFTDPVHAVLS